MAKKRGVTKGALLPFIGRNTDFLPAVIALGLSVFGLVMIWSASKYTAQKEMGDAFYFVRKQAFGLLFGVIAYYCAARLNLDVLRKSGYLLWGASVLLLLLVFVPGIGVETLGARRWIRLGVQFQPSEIAKFAFVIAASGYLQKRADAVFRFRTVLPVLAMGLVTCVLVIAEPNMSVTVCIAAVMILMLFLGGMRVKQLLLLALPLVAVAVLLIAVEPYRFKRLVAFLDPFASPKAEGYQLIQSLYALGSGGWFGVGVGNSRQKYEFLPFSESDFIFSVIGEELGFVGALLTVAVFLLLIARGFTVARTAKDRFGCYLAGGVTAIIAVQTLINIAVVTGSIPPTGIPLPFISYGGSSLVVFLGGIGILQRVSSDRV